MLIAFASPLPVGQSGREELAEVTLERETDAKECLSALKRAMPRDLPPVKARAVGDEHPKLMAMLRTASYMIRVDGAPGLAAAVPRFLARAEIPAIRVSKSGSVGVDIRPMLHELKYVEPLSAFFARVSFTERETLKPDLLMRSLAEYAGEPEPDTLIERLRLFGERNGEPAPLMDC
jgi:radical SAM-linked protein